MPSDLDIKADVYLNFKNLADLEKKLNKMFGNIKLGTSSTQKSVQTTSKGINTFSKSIDDATLKLKKFYSANDVASLKIEKYNMQLKRKMNKELESAKSLDEINEIQSRYTSELKKATLVGQQFIKGFSNKKLLERKRGVVSEEQFQRWQVSLKDVAQQKKESLGEAISKKGIEQVSKDINYNLKK
jgi:hypothetical protein